MKFRATIRNNWLILLSMLLFLICIGGLVWLYLPQKPNFGSLSNLISHKTYGVLELTIPGTVYLGQPFLLSVNLNTNNQKVNAVGLYLSFDPSRLQLTDIDTTKSFCQFYPEKKYDNQMGTVTLACGSPHPGVSGVNQLVTLKFSPQSIGSTAISVSPKSQILSSDGKGSNILRDQPVLNFNILQGL